MRSRIASWIVGVSSGVCLVLASATAGELTIVTWNIDGTNLDGRQSDLERFGMEARPDILVIQELLSATQLDQFLSQAHFYDWHSTVSDFVSDSQSAPHSKLEVGIASHYPLSGRVEVDPILGDDDDTDDVKLEVPDFIPSDQHANRGSRGFLWTEVADLKLVIVSVHLKSSLGKEGPADEKNSFKREAVVAALIEKIEADRQARPDWSYVVAGDFNVAPGDAGKVGTDLALRCPNSGTCTGYDQTHALIGGGIVNGFAMTNFARSLGRTYAKGTGEFADSPIDNIYVLGPLFETLAGYSVRRLGTYGSDHHAVEVMIEEQ